MPSRRDMVQMTPDEIADYLASQRRIIVVTNGPGGLPHPVPMNYGVDDEGRIVITAFRKSQKIRNLERDPRASLLVESGDAYAALKSVIAYADAEIIYDFEQVLANMRLIRSSETLVVPAGSAMDAQVRASMAKRVVVRFTAFRYVSWDHAKLAGHY
jgi:nitroimidazol reductase NimA-like FMN-containing flavoprotein (pyridoxamine 5'-phosphate oxidase superfamily)